MSHDPHRFGRRALLQGLGAAGALAAFPHVWVPGVARAQTSLRGSVRHLLYLRLAGGFRFTCAFNGAVADEFNPFGPAGQKAPGTEWGVSSLLERAPWLDGTTGERQRALGMRPVSAFSNTLCVLPCVDHEPGNGRADGNHGTGLERFLTGYVGGGTGFLTYVNWGVRARVAQAQAEGRVLLPAFSLGEAGMATGAGEFAAYRAPVLEGSGFERFSFASDADVPAWAASIAQRLDADARARLQPTLRTGVEAFQQTRRATAQYGAIFQDALLRVNNRSTDVVDGISNLELEELLGTSGEGRRVATALRLFHFGSPAVFLNQGGYDLHSGEEAGLPLELDGFNRLLSGLQVALRKMQHPEGGTYWDRTLVVAGSEFGRTTGGSRFNSARGSDHSSDLATRWMSMPMMGGVVERAGLGGRSLGGVQASNLRATGRVYSYRGVLKTLLDLLGADHTQVFPQDALVQELA